VRGPNYIAARAPGDVTATASRSKLNAESALTVQQMPMTEAAIDPG
jgi:hypothetical protein